MNGWAPIHFASRDNRIEIIQALIRGGANIFIATNKGLTCLHYACRYGHYEAARIILDANDRQGESLLGMFSKEGMNPIMEATRHRHPRLVQLLIQRGSSTNIPRAKRAIDCSRLPSTLLDLLDKHKVSLIALAGDHLPTNLALLEAGVSPVLAPPHTIWDLRPDMRPNLKKRLCREYNRVVQESRVAFLGVLGASDGPCTLSRGQQAQVWDGANGVYPPDIFDQVVSTIFSFHAPLI